MEKCFIILGMPKSGTSLLSKSLHDQGVCMGEEWLPKGKYEFYENKDFVDLNNRILQAAGGDHNNPPPHEEIMKQDFGDEIQALVEKHRKPLWGWKDPRNSLTAELYLPYVKDPHFIVTFRSLNKVAEHYEGETALAKEYRKRILNLL